MLVLELLSVALLAIILWRPRRDLITPTEAMALTLLLVVPLLYLIPLPAGLVALLPGREPYLAGQAFLARGDASWFAQLSLSPLETESALLLLLLPTAVFIGTRLLDSSRLLRLVHLLMALAAIPALLGLLQYSASAGSPFLFGMELRFSSGRGTYTNVNHFAGLLEMVLPIALALTVYAVGRNHTTSEEQGWRRHIAFLASIRGHAAFGYGAIALVLLVGLTSPVRVAESCWVCWRWCWQRLCSPAASAVIMSTD